MAGSGGSVAHEHEAVLELIAAGVRGLILYPALRPSDAPDFLCSEALGVPVVLIDVCRPEQGHTQVVFDNKRACTQMTRWLLGQGHRHIALIGEDAGLGHPTLDAREDGYREALGEQGMTVDEGLLWRIPLQALGERLPVQPRDLAPLLEPVVESLLGLREPPSAVIACDDIMAIELIELLSGRGVRVPEAVTVVGFDNRVASRHYRPAFPTTQPDFETMGEVACEALLDDLQADLQSRAVAVRRYILPAPLLVRQDRVRPPVPTSSSVRSASRAQELFQEKCLV